MLRQFLYSLIGMLVRFPFFAQSAFWLKMFVMYFILSRFHEISRFYSATLLACKLFIRMTSQSYFPFQNFLAFILVSKPSVAVFDCNSPFFFHMIFFAQYLLFPASNVPFSYPEYSSLVNQICPQDLATF